jgi:hypothetical protein
MAQRCASTCYSRGLAYELVARGELPSLPGPAHRRAPPDLGVLLEADVTDPIDPVA